MKKALLLFAALLFTTIFAGCKDNNELNELRVTDIYVSTYNSAIESTSSDTVIHYLSENDDRNLRLSIEFNKELSEDNGEYLFYMQTGSQIPIIPINEKSDIPFDTYKISGNILEITYRKNERNAAYTTPMSFTGLYIPKGFKAKDGTGLEETFEIYFTGANPHSLLVTTNSFNGSPETIVIGEFGSKWESLYGKKRKVGFVNNENVSLYSGTDIIDTLTIADNVEILWEEGNFYRVNVYRPLPLNDINHHSKFTLNSTIDIFDSKHLKKITGTIEKKYVNTIDLPNDYSYACVFASDHQNYYGLSDVFVEYSIFPLGYHAIMIYDGVNADGTYLQSDEFDTIIYKKLNEIVLNEEFFNMMEVLSYNSFADCFGDAWIRFVYTDEDGKNYSPPIDDVQNHQLLCVYPQAREFVNECLDLHNKYILSHWGNIAAPIGFEDEKAEFDNFVDAKEKLSKIWFEWSEIDTRVKRNTYIQLIKKHFANKNGISTGIIDDYFNNNEDLLSCLGNFIDNELWPQNIIQELDAKLESLSRIET